MLIVERQANDATTMLSHPSEGEFSRKHLFDRLDEMTAGDLVSLDEIDAAARVFRMTDPMPFWDWMSALVATARQMRPAWQTTRQ